MTYLKTGGTWLLTILMTVLMAGPGTSKFTGDTWERMFRQWGYPDGFYAVIGVIEIVAGVGLLVPKLASYAAVILSVVMIGAAATHVIQADRSPTGEIVFASLLAVLAWIRWRDRWRPATTTEVPAASVPEA